MGVVWLARIALGYCTGPRQALRGHVEVMGRATRKRLQAPEHPGGVTAVTFARGGAWVVSVGKDDAVRVVDAATGTTVREILARQDEVISLAVREDRALAGSGSTKGTIALVDLEKGAVLRGLAGHESIVQGVAFSADGRTGYSASADGTVRSWDLETGAAKGTHAEHKGQVNGVAVAGERVVSVGSHFPETLARSSSGPLAARSSDS